MREPCRGCGCEDGTIEERGAQDVVRCLDCNRHCYNAPRVETGKAVRTVQTVHEAIKPKQRARVLARDNFRCVLCGSTKDLHADHVVPVKEAFDAGWNDAQINSDENLIASCAACNLGRGSTLLPLRSVITLYMRKLAGSGTKQ
jgi:5-methylcytosine-specific restriction endonuclease McrA